MIQRVESRGPFNGGLYANWRSTTPCERLVAIEWFTRRGRGPLDCDALKFNRPGAQREVRSQSRMYMDLDKPLTTGLVTNPALVRFWRGINPRRADPAGGI